MLFRSGPSEKEVSLFSRPLKPLLIVSIISRSGRVGSSILRSLRTASRSVRCRSCVVVLASSPSSFIKISATLSHSGLLSASLKEDCPLPVDLWCCQPPGPDASRLGTMLPLLDGAGGGFEWNMEFRKDPLKLFRVGLHRKESFFSWIVLLTLYRSQPHPSN